MDNTVLDDKVLNLVEKLLRLSRAAGATEGEADNALNSAHLLLAKHNLSMEDVQGRITEEQIITNEGGLESSRNSQQWVGTVYQGVADLYFCKYYCHGTTRAMQHCLIGRPSNAKVARMVAEYIVECVQSLAVETAIPDEELVYMDRWGDEHDTNTPARKAWAKRQWRTSFMVGASYRVWSRCVARRKEASAGPTVSVVAEDNLPALNDLYRETREAIDDFVADWSWSHSRASTAQTNSAASKAGKKAADAISLDPIGGRVE